MKKVSELLKSKYLRMSVMAMTLCMCTMATAFAADEVSGDASSIIMTAVDSVKGQATVVIGGALALGVTFWAAKTLWSKFKGMAK